MKITLNEAAEILLSQDNILILTHKSPDGDTIGSGYALCMGLRQLGKKANVVCSDEFSKKYNYIVDNAPSQDFDVKFIVSTDVADTQLLGDKLSVYADKINLCIDHHGSNTDFAEKSYVEPTAAATAQIIKKLLELMNVRIDKNIANAVFTGVCTDTGCFRYTNVTAETHRIAADMIECGADSGTINRIMFDTKSRARIEVERMVLDTMEFFADGQGALVCLTQKMLEDTGATDGDTEGIAAIPRQIEGVKVGITMREKENGIYKFSVRTSDDIDASAICANFGGGGHRAAAGCVIDGGYENAKNKMIQAATAETERGL
ncbi:MAG: bifunctional oligoribonuclease/PAP phosphatase NrnA [Clostridia bacterium]|nr:bifunctional oligoribonuclease/PAP phosphatase NrnA [Clostridia bacterium]